MGLPTDLGAGEHHPEQQIGARHVVPGCDHDGCIKAMLFENSAGEERVFESCAHLPPGFWQSDAWADRHDHRL